MYKLRSKSCHIGPSINTRTQRHGEERVPYLDIPITLSITPNELNSIMSNSGLADAWFETKDDASTEPLLKGFAPYKFRGKFDNSLAKLIVGSNRISIDCGNCTLTKLEFVPQSDGLVTLSLKVQTAASDQRVLLILWLDQDADVSLQFGEMVGDEAQQDLDLEVADEPKHDEDEQPKAAINEVVAGKPKRGRPRKEQRADLN